MDEFLLKIEAFSKKNDICDIQAVYEQYVELTSKLLAKQQQIFALNVLCTFHRNLTNESIWKEKVDNLVLAKWTLDCLNKQKNSNLSEDFLKRILKSIFFILKHLMEQPSSRKSTELVTNIIEISHTMIEQDLFLDKYSVSPWHFLHHRLLYIEKLKENSIQHFYSLTDDILRVLRKPGSLSEHLLMMNFIKTVYSTCKRKNDVNILIVKMIECLRDNTDEDSLRKLTEDEMVNLYDTFVNILLIVMEILCLDSRDIIYFDNFKKSVISVISIFKCNDNAVKLLEGIFLYGFVSIYYNVRNRDQIEHVLSDLLNFCISNDELKSKMLTSSYKYLCQTIKMLYPMIFPKHINDMTCITPNVTYYLMKFMLFLSNKSFEQRVKCQNCNVVSSLHDKYMMLYSVHECIEKSLKCEIDLTKSLSLHNKLISLTYKLLKELKRIGCKNYESYHSKQQIKVHNTAILLNNSKYHEYSRKLFDIYIDIEMTESRNKMNLRRALYNNSISKFDSKLYADGIKEAYLSFVFSLPDGLQTEKYMALVMDLKDKSNRENTTDLISITILDACKLALNDKRFSNVRPYLEELEFSQLLKHEFEYQVKIWPSLSLIAGVWSSLWSLVTQKQPSWVKVEKKEVILQTLYEVILKTPTAVCALRREQRLKDILVEVLEMFTDDYVRSSDLKLIHSVLLFLKFEYDTVEAETKYKWTPGKFTDMENLDGLKTLSVEHEIAKTAIQAGRLVTEAVKDINNVSKEADWLKDALVFYKIYVIRFLHLGKTIRGLQLAYDCSKIARHLGDDELFVCYASMLISNVDYSSPEIEELIAESTAVFHSLDQVAAVCLLCDMAIYHAKIGSKGVAARLLKEAQKRILDAYDTEDVPKLDLALGRVLVAQTYLTSSSCRLSDLMNVVRFYVALKNPETKWVHFHYVSMMTKHTLVAFCKKCCEFARCMMLWRRSRSTCGTALGSGSAVDQASMLLDIVDTQNADEAQATLDNCIRHILGLLPSNELQIKSGESKPTPLTNNSEDVETMLECLDKLQCSPMSCRAVPSFRVPEFFNHGNCECYACFEPKALLISCKVNGLQSSIYFRSGKFSVAKKYFAGTLDSMKDAERHFKSYYLRAKECCDSFIVENEEKRMSFMYNCVLIEILIEYAFFEISDGGRRNADDIIVRIQEIMQEVEIDGYLRSEVWNLMMVASKIQTEKPVETGLEVDMENLKVTNDETQAPKTPEITAAVPPKLSLGVVPEEELPAKRRVRVKLNLDDDDEKQEKREFKMPVLVTGKPNLEITPMNRKKPVINIKKPVEDAQNSENIEFFTPISKETEQFFTPMTSMKTYSKSTLKSNIIKKLEAEFSTPVGGKKNNLDAKTEKLEVPKTTGRSSRSRTLRRATSPGKLPAENQTNSRRLRKPVKFQIHSDVD